MEHQNYELELPAGYVEAYSVDAKENKRTVILFTVVSMLITAAGIAASFFLIRPQGFPENFSFVKLGLIGAAQIIYVVLHELTHGAAYKLLTRQKLSFGLTLTVAFCGVPEIYVYRRAAMIALLAPVTVFTLIYGGAVLLLPDAWDKGFAAMLLWMHIGGCVGDLHNTLLYLTRFRDPKTLMRDTGPKQTFFSVEK